MIAEWLAANLVWIVAGVAVTQGATLSAIGLVLYQFRRHRRFIGSLHSDLQRPAVTPELIQVWKQKVKTLTPGTTKWRAYRKSLLAVDEWDGD